MFPVNGLLTNKTNTMNIKSINKDIELLDKAISLVTKTENHLHFKKSHLIMELCEQVNVLREKRDRQIEFLNSIK